MQALRAFREKQGISQYNMARKLDISLSFYEKIESGHARPSRNFMERIKIAYPEIKIDDMFFSELQKAGV